MRLTNPTLDCFECREQTRDHPDGTPCDSGPCPYEWEDLRAENGEAWDVVEMMLVFGQEAGSRLAIAKFGEDLVVRNATKITAAWKEYNAVQREKLKPDD